MPLLIFLGLVGCRGGTGRQPVSTSLAQRTAATTTVSTEDSDRLEQLRSALDSVNSQELSVAAIRNHIQETTSRVQDLQLVLNQNSQADVLVDEAAQAFRWQGLQQNNAALADLQAQRVNADSALVQLNAELKQLRENLPAGFSSSPQIRGLQLQISALESQKLQLEWQSRSQKLGYSTFLAALAQRAQAQKDTNRSDRADIQNQLAEASQELDYWKRQQAAVGDEAQRLERARALANQIQALQTRLERAPAAQ